MLAVVSGQFAADRGLAYAYLVGYIFLSVLLLVESLNEVSLLKSQSFVGNHSFVGVETQNYWIIYKPADFSDLGQEQFAVERNKNQE
jgi:hypothetical protein